MFSSRTFFVIGLIIALAILVLMSGQALNSSAPPEDVAAGQTVWQVQGCETCHTLYGQGGLYGPDLTHIASMRGESYIREFLVNPNAFHPNERMMPRFLLSREEVNQLFAFLSYVDASKAGQSWPPRLIQVAGGAVSVVAAGDDSMAVDGNDPVATGRRLFSSAPAVCSTCHSLEPDIVIVGPSLAGIADRAARRVDGLSAEEYIRQSIIDPGAYVVDGFENVMAQNLAEVLSSDDLNNLIAFLMTLTEEEEAGE